MSRSHLLAGFLSATVAPTLAIALTAVSAAAQTLYNGSLGTTPESQGWLTLGSIPTTSDSYNSAGVYTTLDTSASNSTYAGYSNYNLTGSQVNSNFPVLNASQGFTLDFTVQVNSENSVPGATTPDPRAGLSVILLDSQHQGIELGFDTNSIFSQAADFSSASEFTSTALPDALTNYALSIVGSTYTLSSGGISLLTGDIKQYDGVGFPASVVYNESNFLFIGDDTTANGGSFNIQSASINTNGAAAPEPGTLPILVSCAPLLLGAVACRKRIRRR